MKKHLKIAKSCYRSSAVKWFTTTVRSNGQDRKRGRNDDQENEKESNKSRMSNKRCKRAGFRPS